MDKDTETVACCLRSPDEAQRVCLDVEAPCHGAAVLRVGACDAAALDSVARHEDKVLRKGAPEGVEWDRRIASVGWMAATLAAPAAAAAAARATGLCRNGRGRIGRRHGRERARRVVDDDAGDGEEQRRRLEGAYKRKGKRKKKKKPRKNGKTEKRKNAFSCVLRYYSGGICGPSVPRTLDMERQVSSRRASSQAETACAPVLRSNIHAHTCPLDLALALGVQASPACTQKGYADRLDAASHLAVDVLSLFNEKESSLGAHEQAGAGGRAAAPREWNASTDVTSEQRRCYLPFCVPPPSGWQSKPCTSCLVPGMLFSSAARLAEPLIGCPFQTIVDWGR